MAGPWCKLFNEHMDSTRQVPRDIIRVKVGLLKVLKALNRFFVVLKHILKGLLRFEVGIFTDGYNLHIDTIGHIRPSARQVNIIQGDQI